MKESVFEKVVDAIDIETVFLCSTEAEGKSLSLRLIKELGFKEGDIISLDFSGTSARVRLRGYVYKPGDQYGWVK
jgi:phosphopantetheine adenylyltransferase